MSQGACILDWQRQRQWVLSTSVITGCAMQSRPSFQFCSNPFCLKLETHSIGIRGSPTKCGREGREEKSRKELTSKELAIITESVPEAPA